MNAATETVVTVITALTGVAIIAILISRQSNTVGVLQAAGSAFSNALAVSVSPVTGVSAPPVLSYPNAGAFSPGMNLPNFRGAL